MHQRMALLLRLGFSQAAVDKAVKRHGGGPYIAEEHIGETVALLRRWGFSQQQLDGVLAGSDTFSRAPADVEAVLAWLQLEFGLQPSGVVQACSKAPTLLSYQQATLQANWRAFEAEFRPTEGAVRRLAATMRQQGAKFLVLTLGTLSHKVDQLQQLFQLDSIATSRYIGHMAEFFSYDIQQTVQPDFLFLQQLTGLPPADLVMPVLHNPGLCWLTPDTLQRKLAAMEAAPGPEGARQLIRARPDALHGVEGRVASNIASLQQHFEVSPDESARIMLANPRLAKLDMQSEAAAARLCGRVAFWQQAYGLPTAADAAVRCVEMLHRSLCTVAPRVAFYRQQRPDAALPHCTTFSKGDTAFCSLFAFDLSEFEAFKAAWLASEEGRAACRHEKQSY